MRFDFIIGRMCIYGVSYGLQSDEFNYVVQFRVFSGCFYFGGGEGFSFFNLDVDQCLVLLLLIVFIKILKIDQEVVIEVLFVDFDVFEISYCDDIFIFEFVMFDFVLFENNCYCYMLQGFCDEWIDFDLYVCVIFMNFDLGSYVF